MEAKKKVFTNGVCSIFAVALFQGILQLVVYPIINRRLGVEKFGDVLYIAALLSVLAPAVGNAVGNIRLIIEPVRGSRNGDFLLPLGVQTILITIAFILLCKTYVGGTAAWILLIVTLVLTVLRTYGESAYRISINYKGYVFYYILLSAGYILGLGLLTVTGNWIWCFLLGELFCVALSIVKGNLSGSISLSVQWKEINVKAFILAGSYLLSSSIGFLDRILLRQWMDNTAVSLYYVSSLIGKIIIMLVAPLNGVLLSYLAKLKKDITNKNFIMIFLIVIGASGVLCVALIVISPIFIRLFYPDLYDSALEISWIVCVSQVFYAAASTLLTILLKMCDIKWQFHFQLFYFLQYVLLSYIGFRFSELIGFAVGGMISNMLQLMVVFCLGLILIRRGSNRKPVQIT